jgi:hypothetical protein
MVATGSGTRNDNSRSHVDVTSREFERRLAAHGHTADEIHRLWDELAFAEPEHVESAGARTLGLGPVIAVYLGLLLVVAASVSVLGLYWRDLGAWGVLGVGIVYLAGYLVASEVMRRRELTQPADVLEAVSIAWVGLVTYAVERLTGVWPQHASDIGHVHIGQTSIAVAGLATALLLLLLRRDPLLFVPIALATVVLAIDLAELVFGNDLSARERVIFILPVGLVWIALGLWLDVARRRDYATWAHWVGLAAVSGAVVVLVPKNVPGFALVGALGAVSLFFSAFVRHWSFTVVGAIGVLMATISAMSLLGRIAPVVIAVVGLALIAVGLRWSKWRETIRAAVLARLPGVARDFLTRLAA